MENHISAFLDNFLYGDSERFAVLLLAPAILQGSAKINVLLHFPQQKAISLFETIEMRIWMMRRMNSQKEVFDIKIGDEDILQIILE